MLLSIIVAVATLSILILVHELGHFFAAKKAGVKVEEFGFGYPPRMLAKKIGQTIYSLNWIPFGGFVRLFGEELRESKRVKEQESKKAFWAKSKKTRTGVILAGVLANFLLGIFLFSVIYSLVGIPINTDQVKVVGVAPDSPAGQAAFEEDDVVLAIDGEKIKNIDHFVGLVEQKKGREIQLMISRGSAGDLEFLLMVREEPPEGEGPLGVVVSSQELKKYPLWQMPFRGTVEGTREAIGWTKLIIGGLGEMLSGLVFEGKVPEGVAGPVGIVQITGAVAQTGMINIMRFMGILSINLAILNGLPFPALDGGRLVFVIYEAITRRRPRPDFERWVNAAGMAFLLALLLLVTINDLDRIVDFNKILERLKSNF